MFFLDGVWVVDLRRLERVLLIFVSVGEVLNFFGGVWGGVRFLLCVDEVVGGFLVVIEFSVVIILLMLRIGGFL